jgi:hypothetical protein
VSPETEKIQETKEQRQARRLVRFSVSIYPIKSVVDQIASGISIESIVALKIGDALNGKILQGPKGKNTN